MTENRLQEIRQRRAGITAGEWKIGGLNDVDIVVDTPEWDWIAEVAEPANRAFIASAPADIDFLLAEIERLQELLDKSASIEYWRPLTDEDLKKLYRNEWRPAQDQMDSEE